MLIESVYIYTTRRGNCTVRKLRLLQAIFGHTHKKLVTASSWRIFRNGKNCSYDTNYIFKYVTQIKKFIWCIAPVNTLCNLFVCCCCCAGVRSWAWRGSVQTAWNVSGRPWRSSSTTASPAPTSGTGPCPYSVWRGRRSFPTATPNTPETRCASSRRLPKTWRRSAFSRDLLTQQTIQG